MHNKLSIQERFLIFLASTGDSEREAARKMGVTHGSIGHMKRGAVMGLDKLERALGAYPELNRMWLLEGVGAMTTDENEPFDKQAFLKLVKLIRNLLPNDKMNLTDNLIHQIGLLEIERDELRAELKAILKKLNA
ncbi:MAG: hypothetical protein ABJG41_01325 [Cyclobacteriaceae bacterium]